jgi:hypothetical protein
MAEAKDDAPTEACRSVWLRGWLNEGLPGPEHFEIRVRSPHVVLPCVRSHWLMMFAHNQLADLTQLLSLLLGPTLRSPRSILPLPLPPRTPPSIPPRSQTAGSSSAPSLCPWTPISAAD